MGVEGRLQKEGLHVYVCIYMYIIYIYMHTHTYIHIYIYNHFVVQQKLMKHCKAIILPFKYIYRYFNPMTNPIERNLLLVFMLRKKQIVLVFLDFLQANRVIFKRFILR